VPRKTDRHSAAHDERAHRGEAVMEGTVGRFADPITRVAVHLSDEHGHQGGGDDKRGRLEGRLAGLQPMAVNHQAATLLQTIDDAAKPWARALDSTLGRRGHKQGRPSDGGHQTS
jgi:hypothetical protein